jgi:hypothetical protein
MDYGHKDDENNSSESWGDLVEDEYTSTRPLLEASFTSSVHSYEQFKVDG